jgi:hypothetical protein
MGWGSATGIFEVVYDTTLQLDHDSRVQILTSLIRRLRDGDWDTYDEAWYGCEDDDALREAFKNNDIEFESEDFMDIERTIDEIQAAVDKLTRNDWVDIEYDSGQLLFSKHGRDLGLVTWY